MRRANVAAENLDQLSGERGKFAAFFEGDGIGAKRIQSQNADTDGKIAQITFEEIAEVLGEDVSTWGGRMQCESSGVWSVYSVTVGQAH